MNTNMRCCSWASDLFWLDEKPYDSATGQGSIGVEFAGTAVSSSSPFGASTPIEGANNQSRLLIRDNEELQWQEGYYRGYYELQISPKQVDAQYFGLPSLRTRNGYEVSLANFTVGNGANKLQRPVAGGIVANGALQTGEVRVTSLTLDTNTGLWAYGSFNFSGVTIPAGS
jgi:alkaline phosphatase D